MNGLFGKILQVDLTNNRIRDMKLPDSYGRKYIGGKGLALKLLLDLFTKDNYDALSAESPIIYMTGPFTNNGIPGSGRHLVMGKSPLTGFLAESYAGGFFGTYLKRTGYDGIVISGKSDLPQYLIVSPDEIKLGNAHSRGLMGKYPSQVQDILKKKYGDVKVSAIGPSGERLVRFSAIINDRNRANGRGGLGAVMGFKNLKAVAVKGSEKAQIYHEDAFRKIKKAYVENLNSNPTVETYGKFGTPHLVGLLNERGILPTRYFRSGEFKHHKKISGEKLYETLLTDRDTCSYCPVRCKRVVKGKYKSQEIKPRFGGPEYETIAAFGSLLEIDDLAAISLANQKCNQYGLDTISCGNVIGFAMEAREKGLIKDDIKWGDPDVMLKLIDDINKRQGLGKYLGEGVKRFSKKVGGSEFAMHGKGLEIPMHEPRGKKGLGISYGMSPRGGTHLEGLHDTMVEKENSSPELGATEPLSRFSLKNKMEIVKNFEDARSFSNSLIQCVFTVSMNGKYYNMKLLRKLYFTITGEKLTAQKMLEKGSMFYDMAREYACSQGLKSADDRLPDRFMKDELTFGDKKVAFSDKEWEFYKKKYYKLRNWDDNGRPKKLKQ